MPLIDEEINLAWIVGFASIAGFALAWAIGANDVANAFGTSVGAKVLTVRQAILCAAIFEFLGAFLMGSQVADTLRDGIIHPEQYAAQPSELAVGMTAAMVGAWFLVSLATYFKLPVSGTHAVIGAVMGFAILSQGIDGVIWEEIGFIILSWVTSPVIAGIMAFIMFFFVRKFILRSEDSFERGLYFMPFCYFGTLAINVFFVVFKGSGGGFIDLTVIPIWGVFLLSLGVGYIVGALIFALLPRIRSNAIRKIQSQDMKQAVIDADAAEAKKANEDEGLPDIATIKPVFEAEKFDRATEELFSMLQVMTACFGSFAHGANDVANAIGPYAVVISVFTTGSVDQDTPIYTWVLAAGGLGIVIGLATWGYKVMSTIGEDLCKVTPSRGFNIELASAITVVSGSKLGLPLSTTHCKVGGVVGVGLADGKNAVNWRLVITVFAGWVVTLPIAAAVSAVFFLVMWNFIGYFIPVTVDQE